MKMGNGMGRKALVCETLAGLTTLGWTPLRSV